MIKVAKLSETDRSELFRNTADSMKLQDAIIEKDFWVCFALDYLFTRSPLKDYIMFKGGTSLSKAYNLVHRFSEDIDLILDWRVLDYSLHEPWEERSSTKQVMFNREANERAEIFWQKSFARRSKQIFRKN
jgi:predicted nucleotidyltransferase component of viral defense system